MFKFNFRKTNENQQVKSLLERVDQLKKQLDLEIEKGERPLKAVQGSLATTSAALAKANAELSDIKVEADSLKNDNKRLRSQLIAHAETDEAKKIDALETENRSLKEQIKKTVAEAEQTIAKLHVQYRPTQNNVAAIEQLQTSLKATNEELANVNKRLLKAQQDLTQSYADNEVLESNLKKIKADSKKKAAKKGVKKKS